MIPAAVAPPRATGRRVRGLSPGGVAMWPGPRRVPVDLRPGVFGLQFCRRSRPPESFPPGKLPSGSVPGTLGKRLRSRGVIKKNRKLSPVK